MYEFIILSQLARGPRHGYLIAKIIDNIIGPVRRAQWGALYPVLNRLQQEGLIEEHPGDIPSEGRPRKVYAITAAGRDRLHELLMDTEHHLAEYDQMFAHKVAQFSQLTPDERLYLSRHYAVYAQQHVDFTERKRRELRQYAPEHLTPDQLQDILAVMDHRIAYWQAERAWAEQLITRQHTTKEVAS